MARNIQGFTKPVLLMAKANCYGLGLKVAKAVERYVVGYGVAYATEGAMLRAITDKPILVTSPVWTLDDVERYALTPSVQSVEDVDRLDGVRTDCAVHIKLNTGMNRYGVRSIGELRDVLRKIAKNARLRIGGAYTHYASYATYTLQNERLTAFLRELPRHTLVHTQASSTADRVGFDMLRIGMDAYRGSVRLTGKVLAVHRARRGEVMGYDGVYTAPTDQTVAVVAGGYADGIDKRMRGHLVMIGGRLWPIVAVCMDVCLVAMDEPCSVGDEVVIIGDGPDPSGYTLYETYTALGGRTNFAYIGDT